MMIQAVTICAQLGSKAFEIASGVAETLGWRLVYRDLVNRAAIACGAPEIALAEIDELGFLRMRPRAALRRAYLQERERMAREIAAQGGAVLLCWASHRMLSDVPGVLHVRIVASPDERCQNLTLRERISAEAAQARMAASDQSRAHRLRRDYGAVWGDVEDYHLVVNSGRLGVPAAVALIVYAVREARLEPAPTV